MILCVLLQELQFSYQWIRAASTNNNTVCVTNFHGNILYQTENAIQIKGTFSFISQQVCSVLFNLKNAMLTTSCEQYLR